MTETVPASRKLQDADARALLQDAATLIVSKGRQVRRFAVGGSTPADAVAAMLGPTGNLRAPAIRAGTTLLVGFNETVFAEVFG